MKQLPVNVSVFSELITNNYLYVDKTKHIYELFNQGGRFFFLSRPRRFGKSLLVSTLYELFSGNRELFEGLWIYDSDFAWKKHPIIHLDFSQIEHTSSKQLAKGITYRINKIAKAYGIDVSESYNAYTKLELLVEQLATKEKAVILIDEYDKPIIEYINNPERAEANREVLKSFYDGFKALDKHLRGLFITGVTRFAKTSLFSGMNNLNDITGDPQSADLIGYTEAEIKKYYSSNIKQLAKEQQLTQSDTIEKIKVWYNGYQFSRKSMKVYNPFSLTYLFSKNHFDNYWFKTGTPSFLIAFLRNHKTNLKNIQESVFTLDDLTTVDLDDISIVPILYQAGYLTIKEYDETEFYRLTYPNEEIKRSIILIEIAVFAGKSRQSINTIAANLKLAILLNNMESFTKNLRSLLASIPYNLHISRESYYHSLLQMICTLLSVDNACEISTSKGSIDMVIESQRYLYICEFKYNKPPREALKQIQKKKYYQRYETDGKQVVLVGISFYLTEDGVELDWISETINN